MSSRLATLAAAAVGLVLMTATPAWANSDISINPGNIAPGGTAAANYGQGCDIGGGPFADQDVWVFILPGQHATSGDFVSVTAHFDTDGNGTADTTKVINTDGGGFVNGGPQAAKAYIALPAGWRLTGAEAVITGKADFFNLTHTCAANGSSSPSPRPSTPTSSSPSPESGTPTPGTGTPTPGDQETPTPGASDGTNVPSTPGSSTAPGLPTTGVSLTTPIISGLVLAAVGALMVMLFRRRRSRFADEA